jgi:Sensors of blue-light using FAD
MFDEFGFPNDDADDELAALMLETFVYCSRAADTVDAAEVRRLIEFSQSRNVARGITGVLVFGSGVFFQWIEGPPAEVQSLIVNLHNDTRHYDIVTLDQSVEKRERLYPHWEMEQVEADDIREVLHEALASTEDESNISTLKRMLAHLGSGPSPSLGRN